VKRLILEIHAREAYEDVNFLHFRDSLAERHGIDVPYSTLESILKKEGHESPKKQKHPVVHRRRNRKEHAGELLQIDATPYDWFRRGEKYALHGAIDDATGIPTGLYLCRNECRLGYLEVLRHTILSYGVPLSLYSDNHTIFRSPKHGKLTAEELLRGEEVKLTQFGRAMDELGVNIIYARSAQAKGRVERMWDTLQSRLPVEFALDGICSLEEANRYLAEKVLSMYGTKWGVDAAEDPIYVPLREDVDIDTILCVKEHRSTDNAGVFSIGGRAFQVLDKGFPLISKGQRIEVLMGLRIGIKVRYRGQVFDTIRYLRPNRAEKPPKKPHRKKIETAKPHLIHGSPEWKRIWHSEDYGMSLEFLYDLFLSGSDMLKTRKKVYEYADEY
jgi:hypothetical protein